MSVPPAAALVGRRELCLASFRPADAATELRELQRLPLPEETFGNGPLGGPVGNPAVLADAVRTLVQRLGGRPTQLSVVLPDAWARGMTVELGELPDDPALANEVLRFRLRKLVPFRIDELRVSAAPIERLAGQEEPLRVLALLAAESVCSAVEQAFHDAGCRVGQLVPAALARLDALAAGDRLPGLAAVAAVEPEGFTLVFARDGAPVLWRQKSFTEGLPDEDRARLLRAELRLTRTFLVDRLGGESLSAALLTAPPAVQPFWQTVLSEGLERPVALLQAEHLPLTEVPPSPGVELLAPLVGATLRRVTP